MTDSVQVRKQRDVPVPAGFRIQDHLSMTGARLAGSANFTMQLAWPGVGYGVMNSRVHDGSAMKHPLKRARTTFTYIAVAMLGTDDERAAYRKAVTGYWWKRRGRQLSPWNRGFPHGKRRSTA